MNRLHGCGKKSMLFRVGEFQNFFSGWSQTMEQFDSVSWTRDSQAGWKGSGLQFVIALFTIDYCCCCCYWRCCPGMTRGVQFSCVITKTPATLIRQADTRELLTEETGFKFIMFIVVYFSICPFPKLPSSVIHLTLISPLSVISKLYRFAMLRVEEKAKKFNGRWPKVLFWQGNAELHSLLWLTQPFIHCQCSVRCNRRTSRRLV